MLVLAPPPTISPPRVHQPPHNAHTHHQRLRKQQQAADGDEDGDLALDRLDEGDDPQGLGWASYPAGSGADAAHVASAATALPDTNKGFQLLLKMGWTSGRGLGRNEDGIVEPVSTGVDAGVRLGLGKQAQDDRFTNPELVTRRLLESEVQANEDGERRQRREVGRVLRLAGSG